MKYVCGVCGYVYDEAKEKTPFADLPDDWKCPLCGAAKGVFKAEKSEVDSKPAVKAEASVAGAESFAQSDMAGLSAGQLAALCSNLARGSEKQYRQEEAELFKELADYFTAVTPPVNDATVQKLADELQKDVEGYGGVRAVADESGDRGAARVCVWGEKVTTMLSSLVNSYIKEGKSILSDTNIWVCTACGFVYIGDNPPQICPVCKVSDWKFERVEGRANV